jgi:hypothetical protein
MRIAFLFAASLTVACQGSKQPEVPVTTTGSTTTVAPGTPVVVRTDTTRPGAGSPSSGSQNTPSGGVTLTLDKASYTPGATVTMRIVSQTTDTLGFNQCSSRAVERQDGSKWMPFPEPDRMCTMELRMLMPKQTQSVTTDLPATLSAGTYRMILTFGRQTARPLARGEGAVTAVSAPFRVT